MPEPNFASMEAELKKELAVNKAERESHEREVNRALSMVEKGGALLKRHVPALATATAEGRALVMRLDEVSRKRLAAQSQP